MGALDSEEVHVPEQTIQKGPTGERNDKVIISVEGEPTRGRGRDRQLRKVRRRVG